MKNIIFTFLFILSTSASAYMIEGTLVLKGSLKTKVVVKSLSTTCKVRVKEVKNLMLEDSYGNPAYKVELELSLDGKSSDGTRVVNFDRRLWINNLFSVGNRTEVRDFEYASPDGVKMIINRKGRIESVSFNYGTQRINCLF